MEYVTVDRVLARAYRDFGHEGMDETDAIERIGEALEHLRVAEAQERAFTVLEVRDHGALVPEGFHAVGEMWLLPEGFSCPEGGAPPAPGEGWERVRLARRPGPGGCAGPCDAVAGAEYAIVGTAERRFLCSFRRGDIGLWYLRNALDPATGYPLVPDDASYIAAIAYYVRWKLAEEQAWNGREGMLGMARESERLWLKYARQAKNRARMPKSADEHRNLMEQARTMAL